MSEGYIDPNQIYAEELDRWEELWDYEKSLYENVYSIASQAVILPQHAIQLPIAATYVLIPSKWAKILPILFSWGDKGTGKSTFAVLAARLHGCEHIFSPADTFASIRNSLDMMRWVDPESREYEKEGVILCWDNLHKDTLLRDNKIYQMLLFGYNRSTERIQIAQGDGTNKQYRVFSPKVISSVHPLHTFPEFEELHRRLLVIRHKQFEKLSPFELNGTPKDFNIGIDRLDLDSINWKGIEDEFFQFWSDEDRCKLYARYRQQMTRKGKKRWTLPDILTGERWVISIDLLCTGLLVGSWQTIEEGIEKLANYWQYIIEVSDVYRSNTFKLLETWLTEKFQVQEEARVKMREAGISSVPKFSFSAKELKEKMSELYTEGVLDININNRDLIKEMMRQLGWRLDGHYWTEIE